MTTPTTPSLSERYQEATKYTPHSVQEYTPLDFSAQPAPFKEWHQARRIALDGGPDSQAGPSPGELDATRLGRLLHHTYGVTLVREFPTMTMHFRAAPSAGGLYPTELYVAVHDLEGIPDGLYAYDARDHSLVVCWEGDFWPDLCAHALNHPAVQRARVLLIGTAIWQRSAWRYGDRGYRRVLLDTGHVFGNAVLAGTPDGLAVVPVPYFQDEGIAGLLLLDETREAPLLLAAVLEAEEAAMLPRPSPVRSSPAAKRVEPESGAWPQRMQQAGRIGLAGLVERVPADTRGAGADLPAGIGKPVPFSAEPLAGGPTVQAAIRRRRSTRTFVPGHLTLEAAGRILAHGYPRPTSADPAAVIAPEVLRSWLVVAGVRGLKSGVYRYDVDAHTATPVRLGCPREALYRSCLGQELGRDCAFAVVHTMDLPGAVATHGERVYRSAHLEAGLIGQRLNMAALRLGYGASGIGGFFDEFLNALLLLETRHAIVYVTAIGLRE